MFLFLIRVVRNVHVQSGKTNDLGIIKTGIESLASAETQIITRDHFS